MRFCSIVTHPFHKFPKRRRLIEYEGLHAGVGEHVDTLSTATVEAYSLVSIHPVPTM